MCRLTQTTAWKQVTVGRCRELLCCCNAILPWRMFWFQPCPAECASTARYTDTAPSLQGSPWSQAICRLYCRYSIWYYITTTWLSVWVIWVYLYKRAVVFSGSRGRFKTCQCSIKTTRAFHVWQSSPSMWLQTKGNGLEQFGLIFAKKIFPPSSQTPFFGTCLFPLKMTPHCTLWALVFFKLVYFKSQRCCVGFGVFWC